MTAAPRNQSEDISPRERRGWSVLFWLITPFLILGFVSNPLSFRGFGSLSAAVLMWQIVYRQIVSKGASVQEEEPTVAPKSLRVTPIGWLFIAVGTLAYPVGMSLNVNSEKVSTFEVMVFAGLGFILSSVLVLLATLLGRAIQERRDRDRH